MPKREKGEKEEWKYTSLNQLNPVPVANKLEQPQAVSCILRAILQ